MDSLKNVLMERKSPACNQIVGMAKFLLGGALAFQSSRIFPKLTLLTSMTAWMVFEGRYQSSEKGIMRRAADGSHCYEYQQLPSYQYRIASFLRGIQIATVVSIVAMHGRLFHSHWKAWRLGQPKLAGSLATWWALGGTLALMPLAAAAVVCEPNMSYNDLSGSIRVYTGIGRPC